MRGSRLWLMVGLIATLAAAMIAAGCGSDEDEGSDTGGTTGGEDLGLITEGTLTVGVDTPYEPFEIGQPPDITGYDIEVMNGIAEELALEPEYIDTGFGTIFRDTASGQFDTAAAAATVKESREEVVDFTDPYYLSQGALLVTEDSDIASVDDLSGLIVGAQDGTTLEEYANEETEAEEVRGYPEGPNAISAMVTGQVDAVIIDLPVAALAIEEQEGIEIVEEIPLDEFFGFPLAPDNDALREAMNEALVTLKEDGTITDLYDEYFQGTKPPKSVLNGTNELLTE